jgi:hypothetical protein
MGSQDEQDNSADQPVEPAEARGSFSQAGVRGKAGPRQFLPVVHSLQTSHEIVRFRVVSSQSLCFVFVTAVRAGETNQRFITPNAGYRGKRREKNRAAGENRPAAGDVSNRA